MTKQPPGPPMALVDMHELGVRGLAVYRADRVTGSMRLDA